MKKLPAFAAPQAVGTLNPASPYFKDASLDIVRGTTNPKSAAHKTIPDLLAMIQLLSPSYVRDNVTALMRELALTHGTANEQDACAVIAVCEKEGTIDDFPKLTEKLLRRVPKTTEVTSLVNRYCQSPGQYTDSTVYVLGKLIAAVTARNAKDGTALRNKIQHALGGPRKISR